MELYQRIYMDTDKLLDKPSRGVIDVNVYTNIVVTPFIFLHFDLNIVWISNSEEIELGRVYFYWRVAEI